MPHKLPPRPYSELLSGMSARDAICFRFDQTFLRNNLILESEIFDLEATLKRLETEDIVESPSEEGIQYWARIEEQTQDNGDVSVKQRGLQQWRQLHEKAQNKNDATVKQHGHSWWLQIRQQAQGNGNAAVKQRAQQIVNVIKELDVKLTKYHKAILRMRELMGPSKLESRTLGGNFSRHTSIFVGSMKDCFNSRIGNYIRTLVMEFKGLPRPPFRGRYFTFSITRDDPSVTLISATLPAIFLVATIVVTPFISNTVSHLDMLCYFTVLFAMVASVTIAREYEVFIAAAASATVLLIFVSGNFAANNLNCYSTQNSVNGQLASSMPTVTVTVTDLVASMDTITQTRTIAATITQNIEIVIITISAITPRSIAVH